MSHVSKLLLLSFLACATACSVPSIEELEKDGPAGCNDSDHPCPSNFVCYENRCVRLTTDMVCRPGTVENCEAGLGECRAGTRACGAEGTFSVCESRKKPRFERCDDLDNDCDGQKDNWAPINFTKSQDYGTSLVALPLDGSSSGEPNAALVITTESGKLVTRTLLDDGSLREGETFSPVTSGGRFIAATAVAAGDQVVMAAIEQPPTVDGNKVSLTLLDTRGRRLHSSVDVPYTNGGSYADASEVRLAINSTHILLLFRATGLAITGAPVPFLWALTVPRSSIDKITNTAQKLGTPQTDFGLHATANGASTQFLVAHESNGVSLVTVVSNDGKPGGALYRDTTGTSHSPFLVPQVGSASNFKLYYVWYDASANVSYLDIVVNADGVLLSPSPYTRAGFIERLQMAAAPGEQMPSLALWVWRDKSGSTYRGLEAANISSSPSIVDAVTGLTLSHSSTFSEVPVQMPDGTHYALYQREPVATVTTAVPLPREVYLQPFCGP